MDSHQLSNLPVVDSSNRFLGLITRGSVVKHLAEVYPGVDRSAHAAERVSDMNAFWSFITERYPDILKALQEHLAISFSAVILGTIIAVPLGIILVYSRVGWINSIVFFVANLFQTVPSLALLAILIPLLGIGMKPAILALLLYSLMPILRNTYDGFHSVDKGVLNSAKGMGYSTAQTIMRIQLPLSLPYIMSGIRITTVYIISWATLAS